MIFEQLAAKYGLGEEEQRELIGCLDYMLKEVKCEGIVALKEIHEQGVNSLFINDKIHEHIKNKKRKQEGSPKRKFSF